MTDPPVFRLLTALLLVAFVAHRAYYTRRYPPAEADTVDSLQPGPASRLASILAVVALLSTMIDIFAPARIAWASLPLPEWVRWLGVVFAVAGFALLEWSHRSLGREWSDRPRVTQSQQIVQTGPYRWIRHPIYASFLLILGSTLLITANWLVGLSWIGSVAIDAGVRIRYEERRMGERFGEAYRAYAARTGRLLPKMGGPAAPG